MGQRLHYWKPFVGTNLLEFSIGREFGGSKGVNAFTTRNQIYLNLVQGGIWGLYSLDYWKLFLGINLLEFSMGRDLGALKGSTPSLLVTFLGDKFT